MRKNADNFENLAKLVASGQRVRSAAKVLSINERTAYEISGTKEFKARVSELRDEVVSQALVGLSMLLKKAVDTLDSCMDSDDDKIRYGAASKIFNTYLPLSENVELRQRIDAIERAAETEEPGDESPNGGGAGSNPKA